MQISVTGHHVDITESMRAYVEEKFAKLERHFDHVTNVHVILSVEKLVQKAEATVHIAGADVFIYTKFRYDNPLAGFAFDLPYWTFAALAVEHAL